MKNFSDLAHDGTGVWASTPPRTSARTVRGRTPTPRRALPQPPQRVFENVGTPFVLRRNPQESPCGYRYRDCRSYDRSTARFVTMMSSQPRSKPLPFGSGAFPHTSDYVALAGWRGWVNSRFHFAACVRATRATSADASHGSV
jgi:hypothetical protein